MSVLKDLQPASVFRFFEEICGIPHTSYHEKAISDYCVNFAKERGLFCQQDEMGNVLIVGEATPGYEQEETVILQGHLDMVGDKVPECPIDLEKDPIQIKVDGDYICAEGTTLGGDNGIAVAYALAILDAKDIPHPRMEVVLTVSEEVGLLGATAMDLSMCKGRRLINVDSEEEGVLTVGCAGGVRVHCDIPVIREMKKGLSCQFTLTGLQGGHSGVEINKGRSNANILLGRLLLLLSEQMEYSLVAAKGGAKENVIPKDGSITVLIKAAQMEVVRTVMDKFHAQMAAEYGTADPDIRLELSVGEETEVSAVDAASLGKIITVLNVAPNGVQSMSADLPGLVETSLNLGVMELMEEKMHLRFSIRSSVASAKEQLVKKVRLLIQAVGGTSQLFGDYPAWPYERNSKLRDLCIEVFKNHYGYEPKVDVLHAGLECGILSGKLPGLDCISMGPNMMDVHTPRERLGISSVARIWEYLKGILAAK